MAFLVPFCRDVTFVDRPHVFTDIKNKEESHDIVALTGQSGIGKTHVAIELCYRFNEQYPRGLVVWVSAGSPARLHQSITEISRKLSIPSKTTNQLLDLLKWLDNASHPDWMLVIDGVLPTSTRITPISQSHSVLENESVITDLLKLDPPKVSRGKIIITVENLASYPETKFSIMPFIIPSWTTEEAANLLRAKLPIPASKDSSVLKVVDILECHPLATTLAAFYIARNDCNIDQYLKEIQALPIVTLTHPKNDVSDEMKAISHGLNISLNMSFAQLSLEKPLAIEILFLMSTLDPQGIPKALLYRLRDKLRPFNAAIRVIKAFSMVTEDSDGEYLYLSRSVHSWVKNKLKLENLWLLWNTTVIGIVAEMFPFGSFQFWRSCSFLMPHATKLISRNLTGEFCLQCSTAYVRHRAIVLKGISSFEENRGMYILAYENVVQALNIVKDLEPSWRNRKDVIETSKTTARILCELGRYQDAEHLMEQILNEGIDQNKQDEEDISLLNAYNTLAFIAHQQADYETAEKYYKEALETNIREHYEDHVDTLIIKSNFAGLRMDQGNYEEAARMLQEVLNVRRISVGVEHPDTLQTMSDLAVVLISQGYYPEAEKKCRDALVIANKVQGAEHPRTLAIYGNLAGVLSRRGKYEEAAKMRRHLIALKEASLGHDDIFLINDRNSLALNLEKMGEYVEAEKIFKPTLTQAEKAFGKDHPTTLNIMNGLGLVLLRQGRYKEVEPMLRNILKLRIQLFGEDHEQTLTSKNNLAGCLQRQSLFLEAEKLHRETLAAAQKVRGNKHPFTLRSMNNVAEVLRDQGNENVAKLVEAEEFQRGALAGRREVLGVDHPETFTSMHNLARILKQQRRVGEALPLYKCALKGFEEKLGKENATTKTCAEELAELDSAGRSGLLV